jgi:hypothetical protein
MLVSGASRDHGDTTTSAVASAIVSVDYKQVRGREKVQRQGDRVQGRRRTRWLRDEVGSGGRFPLSFSSAMASQSG